MNFFTFSTIEGSFTLSLISGIITSVIVFALTALIKPDPKKKGHVIAALAFGIVTTVLMYYFIIQQNNSHISAFNQPNKNSESMQKSAPPPVKEQSVKDNTNTIKETSSDDIKTNSGTTNTNNEPKVNTIPTNSVSQKPSNKTSEKTSENGQINQNNTSQSSDLGEKIVFEYNESFNQPLIEALKRDDVSKVRECIKAGANPNYLETSTGYTALSWAVLRNNVENAAILLDAKADPNGKTSNGNTTPLHQACGLGNATLVKLLLDYGADTSAKNAQGVSVLLYAEYIINYVKETDKNRFQEVIDLLKKYGAHY